jgi:hypothetical protein
MAADFYGISTTATRGTAVKALLGFYGVRVEVDGVPVRVVDRRGRGLSNVTLFAPNPVGGTPYETTTDGQGNALITVDASGEIQITWFSIRDTINYDNQPSFTIVINETLMK